jgi:23S rRNA (uracil1939-C5)-methyltransferase
MTQGDGMVRRPRPGDEIGVTVTGVDTSGQAVGRSGDMKIRLRHGLPGESVRARVIQRRGGTAEAVTRVVLLPSPEAVVPLCRHFGFCGGCSFQDLRYQAQLRFKRDFVVQALHAAGVKTPAEPPPVIPCDPPFGYRNKMEFTFGRRFVLPGDVSGAEQSFALGLHVAGRHEKVLEIERCEIQFPEGNPILRSARDLAKSMDLEPWDLRAQSGLLRHLVLRRSDATGEIMVNLVTSERAPERLRPYIRSLLERHPEITTFVQNINRRAATIAVGQEEIVHHGPGVIHEQLAGLRFAISANTFFQTNTRQAERLVAEVLEAAALRGDETVWDLCSGSGTLTLISARLARRVIGVESAASAVNDARRNAEANGFENVRFIESDVVSVVGPGAAPPADLPPPDLCIVDPPRAGLHARVLAGLRRLRPPRIVYVSCNMRATARDLAAMTYGSDGYLLTQVQGIDMFPHTPHVECVLRLDRA